MQWVLSRFAGYVGLIASNNHVFKDKDLDTNPMIDEIFDRGLGFVDSNAEGTPFAEFVSKQANNPYARNDLWLDEDLKAKSIAENFRKLERLAQKNGRAIGFIRPYPISFQITTKWVETLDKKGVQLAPLSALTE